MKILIYDSNQQRGSAHCNLLHSIYPGWEIWHGKDGDTTAMLPNTEAAPVEYDLGFLHDNAMDELHWSRMTINSKVLYNGGGCLKPCGVPRAVSYPDAILTIAEIKTLCDLIFAAMPKTMEEAIKIVWRDNEPMIALRLLCEAYVVPTAGAGYKNYQPTESGTNPISVYCPDPSTWFELLGAAKPEGSDEQIGAAIAAFGRLMGEAGNDAMELGRAIILGGSNIGEAAGKLVKQVSGVTAAQSGGSR